MTMATCKICGRENEDLYKFCLGCGAELGDATVDAGEALDLHAAHRGERLPDIKTANGEPTSDLDHDFDLRDRRDSLAHLKALPADDDGDREGDAGGPGAERARSKTMPPSVAEDFDLHDRRDSLSHLKPMPPLSDEDVAAASDEPSTDTDPNAGRICPHCGTLVAHEFAFCSQCGARIEGKAPAPPTVDIHATEQVQGQLVLIRPDGSEGGMHPIGEGENCIGRGHGPLFDADGYLSPRHAELVLNAAGLVVRDTGSLNGVFVRLTDEEELVDGDIFRIGQELLRFDEIQPPVPLDDGTDIMGSPNPGYWGRLALIVGRDQDGSAFPLFGDAVTLGRERGDILFPEDGYVSGAHARVFVRNGRYFLTDLNSSNGTFLRVRGERAVKPGTAVLMGQQLFRVSY
jgi:FHA domain-containing protein